MATGSFRLPQASSGIVNLHQRPGGHVLTQIESKHLEHLKAGSPGAVGAFDLVGLKPAVSRLIGPLPPRLGKHHESARVRGLILLDNGLEARAYSAGEIDHGSNILAVHEAERGFG